MNTYDELKIYMQNIKIIDTHEHLPQKLMGADVFDLTIAYIPDLMKSAGMTLDEYFLLQDKSKTFDERYDIFIKYYPFIKTASFYKAFELSMIKSYGLKEVSREEFLRIDNIIRNEDLSNLYQKIFDECNIEKCYTFVGYDETEGFTSLIPVPTVSDIFLRSPLDIDRIGRFAGISIHFFDDLLRAIDIIFEKYNKQNIRNIKFASGNRRVLNFAPQTKNHAEEVFLKVANVRITGEHYCNRLGYPALPAEQILILDDYLTAYMVFIAQKYSMNVVFHVSTHVWNYNSVESCHAKHLEWLVNEFKDVRFVLLHCGMPFIDEAILLAKYFPNVYLNMTWCHIIDRLQTIELIQQCATMLPLNKIHAFGGDYLYPHTIIGHLDIAKDNFAVAFSRLIELGFVSPSEAKHIINLWFYENPKSFY